MNDSKRLPLDSPLWNSFETFGVAPGRIPLILRKLTEDSVDPNDPGLDELASGIFHQYSLTDATYASFPYLAEICARYMSSTPSLFYLAANIAASANVDKINLLPEVREAFLRTLIELEAIAISKVITKGQPIREIYCVSIAAMAFSRHCCGKLLMDVLRPETEERTSLICPQCQQYPRDRTFRRGCCNYQARTGTAAPDESETVGQADTMVIC